MRTWFFPISLIFLNYSLYVQIRSNWHVVWLKNFCLSWTKSIVRRNLDDDALVYANSRLLIYTRLAKAIVNILFVPRSPALCFQLACCTYTAEMGLRFEMVRRKRVHDVRLEIAIVATSGSCTMRKLSIKEIVTLNLCLGADWTLPTRLRGLSVDKKFLPTLSDVTGN